MMLKKLNAAIMHVEAAYHRLAVRETVKFRGDVLNCYYHPYNRTAVNERKVELPIVARLVMEKPGRHGNMLEVGHTIGHYPRYTKLMGDLFGSWTVVDKYERAPGVINEDIMTFDSAERYDLIVSISTIEHIGRDEVRYSELFGSDKTISLYNPMTIVGRLKNMLASGGRLVVTWTPGFNPDLDTAFLAGELGFTENYWLRVPHPIYIGVYDAK